MAKQNIFVEFLSSTRVAFLCKILFIQNEKNSEVKGWSGKPKNLEYTLNLYLSNSFTFS